MSTFNEGQHPRGQAGKFATKAKAGAGVSLGPLPRGAGEATDDERAAGIVDAITAEVANPHEDIDHWLDQTGQHLDHLDADKWEDEFCQPIARAIKDGRGQDAEHLASQLVALDTEERRWRQLGYTEPTFTSDMDDSGYGPRIIGSRYDPNRTPAQIASLVRHDLTEAAKAGYLPREAHFDVTSDRSGGGEVHASIEGVSDEYACTPTDEHPYAQGETAILPSKATVLMTRRAEGIINQYTSRWTDSSQDFSHVSTHASAVMLSANQVARHTARRQAAREAREGRRDSPAATEARIRKADAETDRLIELRQACERRGVARPAELEI